MSDGLREQFGTRVQRDAAAATRPFEDTFERFRGDFARDVDDTGQELRRLGGGLSTTIARGFKRVGRNFNANLTQLERKARARQQIGGRGENAILNQQLKDRIGIAREGIARRQVGINAAGASARARLGLDASLQNARDIKRQGLAGAVGGVAGGLFSGLRDKFNFGTSVDPAMDQGTFGADLILNDRNVDVNFNPNVDPGSQVFPEQLG